MTGTSPIVRRSRSGCQACRKRRRKCDECKPSCGYCKQATQPCSYDKPLSWGGRPFTKSRFGSTMHAGAGVVKVSSSHALTYDTTFVYAVAPQISNAVATSDMLSSGSNAGLLSPKDSSQTKDTSSLDLENISQSDIHENEKSEVEPVQSSLATCSEVWNYGLTRNPNDLSWIPSQYRFLLHHFREKMSLSISCHPRVQEDMCSTLIPMALHSSHLLASVLYLAACHRYSLGAAQDAVELEHLKISSLSQLRLTLSNTAGALDVVTKALAIASTLTLCTAAIVSGGSKTEPWRIHFEGAESMWTGLNQAIFNTPRNSLSQMPFLERWYISFKTVALACCSPRSQGYIIDSTNFKGLHGHYIDEFSGFSTSLIPVFEEIAALQTSTSSKQNSQISVTSAKYEPHHAMYTTQDTCEILLESINHMLYTRQKIFRPEVEKQITDDARSEYFLLDEACHHMARIQILVRSEGSIPNLNTMVYQSVIKIISCIASMPFGDARPIAAALPPLFIAGCHAHEKTQQQQIVQLLDQLERHFGMGNVRIARIMLLKIWSLEELSTIGVTTIEVASVIRDMCDFLPY